MSAENSLPELIGVYDVKDWLGVSVNAIKRMVRAKQIPHFTLPNGEIVFDRAELTEWIELRRSNGRVVPE
jgi:hypothetical protein